MVPKRVCGFDGGDDVWTEESSFKAVCNFVGGDPFGVELFHHPVHERGP